MMQVEKCWGWRFLSGAGVGWWYWVEGGKEAGWWYWVEGVKDGGDAVLLF